MNEPKTQDRLGPAAAMLAINAREWLVKGCNPDTSPQFSPRAHHSQTLPTPTQVQRFELLTVTVDRSIRGTTGARWQPKVSVRKGRDIVHTHVQT